MLNPHHHGVLKGRKSTPELFWPESIENFNKTAKPKINSNKWMVHILVNMNSTVSITSK